MARPNWEYIRVDVLLPGHPKLAGLPRSARWTLVELWCYCGRYHTDGLVEEDVWKTIGTRAEREALVRKRLAERVDGGYQMHEFTGHNRSKAEIEQLSARRAEAGRKGGSVRRGNPEASASASAKQPASTVPKQTEAEAEAEAEAEKKDPPALRAAPRGAARGTRIPEDFRVSAEMAAWARKEFPEIDIADQTMRFRDHFEAASGEKARAVKWDARWRNWIRRASEMRPAPVNSPPLRQSTTDQRVAQAQALKAELRAAQNGQLI